MFAHDFVRNAYLAGTFIALACGVVGWFVVLRAQVFAGDALSHVAFVGAIAAAVVGLDTRVGLYGLTLGLALAMAALGRRAQPDDVVIGTVFTWILGLGILMITLLSTSSSGGEGITAVNTLFGSIYSLGAGASRVAAVIAVAVVLCLATIFRPLLLATLDPVLASIRGVRVRLLGAVFLVLLAIVSAESTEAVGALLLLGLLAAPAGAAHRVTARPGRGLALSGLIAVGSMWGGLALAYAIPALPPSSAIVALAAGSYGAAAGLTRGSGAGRRSGRRAVRGPDRRRPA
jgi:zinc/manganese transport system permease protein